ncbi:chorismate--pyruvate lyase family protein [Sulfuritalea sp.]|uniref:chorismate--pyruvate lyase family protein n=1 Tax=Sulfuritalea sp. TaxID=2480090 RepID=UPI00286DF52A|nr:chorismate lyase [Sulfuritalea sp.]
MSGMRLLKASTRTHAAGNGREDTQWRPLTQASARLLPRPVRPWMMLASSMTIKLGEQIGKTVLVNLLREERDRLHPDERSLFRSYERKGFVREVCLYSGDIRLLSARTVFLSDRLKRNAGMASLGRKSLGELLFPNGRPAMWTLREYALIGPTSPLFPLVRRCGGRRLCNCWARRSMFLLDGEPLLGRVLNQANQTMVHAR